MPSRIACGPLRATIDAAMLVPGNRLELIECRCALAAVEDGELDGEPMPTGRLDVLCQHILLTVVDQAVDVLWFVPPDGSLSNIDLASREVSWSVSRNNVGTKLYSTVSSA